MGGELWTAYEGTDVSTGGRAHSSLYFSADQGAKHVCKFLCECLGHVLVRQLTVTLRESSVKKMNAWICALLTTENDLASVIPEKKRVFFFELLGPVTLSSVCN